MTAKYEYFHINRENMLLRIQMQLCENPEIFSGLFYAVLESTLNFRCFETKMKLIGEVFLKLLTPKDVLTEMHNRVCFWKHFSSERVNGSQKLLKSAEKYFCPTFSLFWANFS